VWDYVLLSEFLLISIVLFAHLQLEVAEMCLLAFPCSLLCLSTSNESRITEQIFKGFRPGEFYIHLSKNSRFGYNQTITTLYMETYICFWMAVEHNLITGPFVGAKMFHPDL
jgi:hypothetical protein